MTMAEACHSHHWDDGDHDDHSDDHDVNHRDASGAFEVKDLWYVGDNLITDTDSTHRSNLGLNFSLSDSISLTSSWS